METPTDDEARVKRAAEFINGYQGKYDPNDDDVTAAIDLMADMFHYLHRKGTDVPRIVMEIAWDHFRAESEFEGARND